MARLSQFDLQTRLLGLVAALLLGGLAVLILVTNPFGPDVAARGRWTAEARCGGCHDVAATAQADRRSGVPSFAALAARFPDAAAAEAFLRRPHAAMPPQTIPAEEVAQLSAYLASLRRP
ncbi:c-type cytochrome [Falsiroseomonas selenitidurans]|uniref:Cytochrome c n=1 Tax=Falsiroseomonas selenitidurans TaxID=2716335 RepID=A0ABX1EB08_9PROT|nr:cytochrome c [Falsiroseomonas selenitidurans]NKC34374.1 cytochrome c [Falsiroseomonas selenitidurans]